MSSSDPPAFAARMPCSTTPNRAQGHHPVATSTTNLRRSFLATVCRMPGTAWLRGRLLKRSVIALSYSVGKWWQWKVWCVWVVDVERCHLAWEHMTDICLTVGRAGSWPQNCCKDMNQCKFKAACKTLVGLNVKDSCESEWTFLEVNLNEKECESEKETWMKAAECEHDWRLL